MNAFWKLFRSVDAQEASHTGEEVAENTTNVENDDEIGVEEEDYSSFTKKQLSDKLIELLKEFNTSSFNEAKKIRECFLEIHESEKSEALEKFVAEGGEQSDFQFEQKDFETFENNFKSIKSRHGAHIHELNKQKEENYQKKFELLEKLREFINAEETESSIKQVKDIQDEWKKIGPVPNDKDKDLYKNYSALLSQYYDKRSIYNELKELDRKKNLEHKIELCEKAEKLASMTSVNLALKELNELHVEFKNTGPVPKEKQEEIWQRFKTASDKIYDLKKNFIENQNKVYEENLTKKDDILKELEPFANFESTSLEEWNKATEKLLAFREKWKAAGFLSKEKSKDYNKKFWAIFKNFFNNKRTFFKVIDKERNENLAQKVQLCELAEQIWEKGEIDEAVLNEIKSLQRKWKEIGAVPNKKSNEVYFRFKNACDRFFNKKRDEQKAEEEKQKQGTKDKTAFCDELEADNKYDLSSMLAKWASFGNNNRKEDNAANERFFKIVCKTIDDSEESGEQKSKNKILAEVEIFKGSGEAGNRLVKKEKTIRTKIQELENNIALWNNNLGFFANSKNAKSLTSEFDVKIKQAEDEIVKLKEQLKIIKKM